MFKKIPYRITRTLIEHANGMNPS